MESEFEKLSNELLTALETIARNKYEEEKAREESLISQASNMQSVFAISTAALFMLLPILIDNRGSLELQLFFIFISIITAFLLVSLVFATLAQWRFKMLVLPEANSVISGVAEKLPDVLKDIRMLTAHNITQYTTIQKNRAKYNRKRVIFVCISMCSFFLSILFCAIFFIVAVIKLLI